MGFPHANTRSEIAVKTAKRVLRANTSITGELDNVAVTRAILQYRNTPDRDIGMSPAQLLYGRQLRDFLPGKPQDYVRPKWSDLRQEWQDIAEWCEKALAKRCSKIKEKALRTYKGLATTITRRHSSGPKSAWKQSSPLGKAWRGGGSSSSPSVQSHDGWEQKDLLAK